MSYEKQTWNKYDELKTEEENIENGAVVTDNRMNHMESGIGDNDNNLASHLADKNNPHKVTAAQVGLGNVQNFGLATEDEAKQGISSAKYMTPSLTQAVLSANINSIAYAKSADGTDGFTTVYPNLNLINQKDLVPGYLSNTGALVPPSTDANERTSSFLEVDASQSYTAQVFVTLAIQRSSWCGISWFDENQTFINRTTFQEPNVPISGNYNYHYTVKPPSNAKFVRISFRKWGDGKLKLEKGTIATPWMPSASEVTTADWPKYVGFSNAVKTNKSASDYTWFPVKDSELTNKVDSHINNKANPHSVTATQVGAYTKAESDSKLTDLSNKVIANKGNLASGTDLDNVIDIGTYRIGGLTGGTDIINVPSERSGTTIYAYLTVSGTTTSVVQELIVYDSKTVSQIYSRSRSGSTPTFSPWSKTVMADDSGKVTVKDLEVTGTITSGAKNVLANGAYWMQAGQVITPSKSISDCANGWILHFTSYTSGMTGATKNGNNHFFYIPKEQVNIADVGTMFPLVVTDGTMTLKYLYLQNNKITGTSANESTNSKKYVLQNVLEY